MGWDGTFMGWDGTGIPSCPSQHIPKSVTNIRLTTRTGISRPGTVPSRRGTGMGPNLCGMGAPGPGLAWDRDGMGRGLGGMGWDRDPGLSRPACYQTALPMLNSSLYSSQ